MLKIKDNVDLRILNLYEFQKYRDCYAKHSDIARDLLCVDIEKRAIYIDVDDTDSGDCADLLETLFDLIQARLVEKVGDEN